MTTLDRIIATSAVLALLTIVLGVTFEFDPRWGIIFLVPFFVSVLYMVWFT